MGIRVIVYLDDFLIASQQENSLIEDTARAIGFLEELGWIINKKKSLSPPTHCLEYLGIMWDTKRNRASLPDKKKVDLRRILVKITKSRTWNWITGKRLVGKLNFASFTVPLGRLHTRHLQRAANCLPQHQKTRKYLLPTEALQECSWWLKNLQNGREIFTRQETIFITTDASEKGWGAQVNGLLFSGLWTEYQIAWHINRKELFAVYQAFQRALPHLQDRRVIIQTDNKTVVSYIRNQGGTRSSILTDLVANILELAYKNRIETFAHYIPGIYNEIADSLSRQKSLADWYLSDQVTSLLFKKWGTPQIDLFATPLSRVVPIYVARDARDKGAAFIR
nr:uncharacterized protein LOC126056143 [Helicoverpa armigera]